MPHVNPTTTAPPGMSAREDAGRTSYFRHSESANVKLKEAPAKSALPIGS